MEHESSSSSPPVVPLPNSVESSDSEYTYVEDTDPEQSSTSPTTPVVLDGKKRVQLNGRTKVSM
jgi:hypothetical protein